VEHTSRSILSLREGIDVMSDVERYYRQDLKGAFEKRARIPAVDRLEYFLRSRASKVVVVALVANTMVAQLLYNSAGQLVLDNQVLLAYLLVSAICSTVAFALFEVSTIFQLHDLMALDSSIKQEIRADTLIKRGYFVLAVSSLINFLSVLYFLALAWHTGSGVGTTFPLDDLPQPWNWLYYGVHASAYTAVLFLAGIFGERPKSGKEVILATQRALEQQALERWKLQKEAQIEQMMRDGLPLGAVAAALASPETAERIAVLEAATSGGLSALDAARLNVRRSGGSLALLDGLTGSEREATQPAQLVEPLDSADEGLEAAEVATFTDPFALSSNGNHRTS
jgi:hypothetical protein